MEMQQFCNAHGHEFDDAYDGYNAACGAIQGASHSVEAASALARGVALACYSGGATEAPLDEAKDAGAAAVCLCTVQFGSVGCTRARTALCLFEHEDCLPFQLASVGYVVGRRERGCFPFQLGLARGQDLEEAQGQGGLVAANWGGARRRAGLRMG